MILVFDIGGMSIKYALVDELGNITNDNFYKTDNENFEVFYHDMKLVIEQFKDQIKGVSISSPGAVDVERGTVGGVSAVSCIHGPNFKELIKADYGFDVSIENDANCAALAEYWLGNGQGKKIICSYVIGTGIGGAVIIDGKLISGGNSYTGEFGFMMQRDRDGVLKRTSTLGGFWSLEDNGKKLYGEHISGKDLIDEYFDGNKIVFDLVDDMILHNALAIYNIKHALDPEVVLIGGACSKNVDYINKLNEKYQEIYEAESCEGLMVEIKACKFSNQANLIGAAYNFYNTQN